MTPSDHAQPDEPGGASPLARGSGARTGPAANGPSPSPAAFELLDPDQLLTRPQAAWLMDASRRVLAFLNHTGEVRAKVINDAQMADAHRRTLGLDSTTDVLTFDLSAYAGPNAGGAGRSGGANGPASSESARGSTGTAGAHLAPPLDVDLLICVDEARRQSAARGHSIERELLLYILHGVLHCLGEDDHDPTDAARMHAREDEVLDAIGVGATFSRECKEAPTC